jgi:osmotically-inducible protein OsmY
MRSLLSIASILAILAAGGAAGTTATTPRPIGPGPKGAPAITNAPRAKTAPVKPDAEIEKEIRARLAKSKIGAEKFQVHVQGGVATLEGKTNVIQHKGVATRLARSSGAVAVANHIEISEAAREKAAQNLETGRRRAQIKRGEARSETATSRQSR